MTEPDKKPVTSEELLVSSLAQTDALAKLLIDYARGVYSEVSRRDGTYQKLLNPPLQRALLPSQEEHP
jgi:hypothetical protein